MKANMGVSYKAQMAKLVEVSLFGKHFNLVNDPEQWIKYLFFWELLHLSCFCQDMSIYLRMRIRSLPRRQPCQMASENKSLSRQLDNQGMLQTSYDGEWVSEWVSEYTHAIRMHADLAKISWIGYAWVATNHSSHFRRPLVWLFFQAFDAKCAKWSDSYWKTKSLDASYTTAFRYTLSDWDWL